MAAAVLAVTWPAAPRAHEVPARVAITAWVTPEDGRLEVLVRVPLEAMRDVVFPLLPSGDLDAVAMRALLPDAVRTWVAGELALFEDGRPLVADPAFTARLAAPGDRAFATHEGARAAFAAPTLGNEAALRWQRALVDVRLTYPITSATARFSLRPTLARLGLRTTTALHFVPRDGAPRTYTYVGDPGVVPLDPGWWDAASRFIAHGVAHILGGLDHLLFLWCLVLPVRGVRALVAVVTAFTVAHSITLVAAALGVVPTPLWFPAFVETLIAASIVWMALENLVRPPDRLAGRWRMAFAFGLVHGFGFSFALGDTLQFAGGHLVLALAAFNVGVELGQLAVLAVTVPLLAWLAARVNARALVLVASAVVAHTAWHWMLERAHGLAGVRLAWPTVDALFWRDCLRAALLATIAAAAAWGLAGLARRLVPPPGDRLSPAD